jgi:hypothetical protein
MNSYFCFIQHTGCPVVTAVCVDLLIVVSILFPQAALSSLPNAALMSPYQSQAPDVRSGNASLQFFWRGVHDPTISALYFRFSSLSEWSPLPLYKTAAMLEREAGRRGVVTAQIRAVNQRDMTSNVAATSVMLDDAPPSLTGRNRKIFVCFLCS